MKNNNVAGVIALAALASASPLSTRTHSSRPFHVTVTTTVTEEPQPTAYRRLPRDSLYYPPEDPPGHRFPPPGIPPPGIPHPHIPIPEPQPPYWPLGEEPGPVDDPDFDDLPLGEEPGPVIDPNFSNLPLETPPSPATTTTTATTTKSSGGDDIYEIPRGTPGLYDTACFIPEGCVYYIADENRYITVPAGRLIPTALLPPALVTRPATATATTTATTAAADATGTGGFHHYPAPLPTGDQGGDQGGDEDGDGLPFGTWPPGLPPFWPPPVPGEPVVTTLPVVGPPGIHLPPPPGDDSPGDEDCDGDEDGDGPPFGNWPPRWQPDWPPPVPGEPVVTTLPVVGPPGVHVPPPPEGDSPEDDSDFPGIPAVGRPDDGPPTLTKVPVVD